MVQNEYWCSRLVAIAQALRHCSPGEDDERDRFASLQEEAEHIQAMCSRAAWGSGRKMQPSG